MVTQRIKQITAANDTLLSFLPIWEAHRHQPGIADFAFGNPQEMVVDGFASTLAAATVPLDKNHYAYKFSEEESRRTVASHLTEWRRQEFSPEDVAMTPGAFGAIAVALGTLVDFGDEVVYPDPGSSTGRWSSPRERPRSVSRSGPTTTTSTSIVSPGRSARRPGW